MSNFLLICYSSYTQKEWACVSETSLPKHQTARCLIS